MTTTRSEFPLELPAGMPHGIKGWQYGCGCFVCRRGKADKQAKYREGKKRRDEGKSNPKIPEGAGEIEVLVRREFAGLGELNDDAATIAALAIKSAKLLDKIEVEGKFHLQGATVKTLRELLRELHGTMNATAGKRSGEDQDDLEDFGTLGSP